MGRPRILLCLLLGVWSLRADVPADNVQRGAKVEWARLRTRDLYWDRHAAFDRVFLEFIRAHTSLNIDVEAHWVQADSLDHLCRFPFIFAANIEQLAPDERANLAEYLRRGGFILMDTCLDRSVTPNRDKAAANEVRLLTPAFPNLNIVALPPTHPVFSNYLKLKGAAKQLIGIYDGKHLIGMISLCGLECDLADFHKTQSPFEAAQMLTNIYLYALTGDRSQPAPSTP
jgi:hypothetical protein